MAVRAVVLAAGAGTRMKSTTPKVLVDLAGRPLLHWVLDALAPLNIDETFVVVGHQAEEVAEILPCEMVPTAPKFSGGRLRILDEEDEFIRSLPFQTIGAYGVFGGSNNILPLSRTSSVGSISVVRGSRPWLKNRYKWRKVSGDVATPKWSWSGTTVFFAPTIVLIPSMGSPFEEIVIPGTLPGSTGKLKPATYAQ